MSTVNRYNLNRGCELLEEDLERLGEDIVIRIANQLLTIPPRTLYSSLTAMNDNQLFAYHSIVSGCALATLTTWLTNKVENTK